MALMPQTKELLAYLQKHPDVRARIAAPPGRTLLYAGHFFMPIWKELEYFKLAHPEAASKTLLPEVLARIQTPGQPHASLLAWAKSLDSLSPWKDNGFIAWRALSGIFAANAVGAVSFNIGSGITAVDKVFAATELPVLARNPNVDAMTKDILAYYERCIRDGKSNMNFAYLAG
jgi:hypothetical protein